MDKRLLQQISSARHKFNACRIKQNQFNLVRTRNQTDDYIFQQIKTKIENNVVLDKQNIDPKQITNKHKKQIANEGLELRERDKNNCAIVQMNKSEVENESEDEDLTDLWNQAHQQQSQTKDNKINQQEIEQINEDSDSSCQMAQQYLRAMNSFSVQANNLENSQKQVINNCISQIQVEEVKKGSDSQDSWAEIAQEMQNLNKNQNNKEQYHNQGLVSLANINDVNIDETQEFVIIDTPSEFFKAQSMPGSNCFEQQQLKIENYLSNDKKILKYGPWVYNTETYQIHQKPNILLVYKIYRGNECGENNEAGQYEHSRCIRIINWEISEEKKPQIRALRSKRNCYKMSMLEHGEDFHIFDHSKFVLSALRENTHIYLGMKAYCNNYSADGNKTSKKNFQQEKAQQKIALTEHLYLPSTGESLLQSRYCSLVDESEIKKFSIHLSLTGEKLATCERYVYDQDKDKKEVLEVKLYDSFQQKEAEFLGVIESKISSFSEQWYCDSVVYIPQKKTYSSKLKDKNWEKFKIQLKLSELGTIVAELGIFDASSSVTNCILFGDSKSSQFMMGTIMESCDEINYILRVAGLSPLMAFAIAISRKIFVLAS